MHHLIKILLGNKLHLALIGKNPHRILDLRTGAGIWAIKMGEFLLNRQPLVSHVGRR